MKSSTVSQTEKGLRRKPHHQWSARRRRGLDEREMTSYEFSQTEAWLSGESNAASRTWHARVTGSIRAEAALEVDPHLWIFATVWLSLTRSESNDNENCGLLQCPEVCMQLSF